MFKALSLVIRDAGRVPAQTPRALHAMRSGTHRSDIEGLRGVAVLSLLAIHCFPSMAMGSYIGIDIFFVLSGYLITELVLRSLRAQAFSLRAFYSRRVRRILPALCVVLLACLLFGVVFTLPTDARALGRQVGIASLFLSNFLGWTQAGSFEQALAGSPLLHLWSLAFEMQFYLLWPVALALAAEKRARVLLLIGATLAASFALHWVSIDARPIANFFLPWGRWWEFMAGALLGALTLSDPGHAFGKARSWLEQGTPTARRVGDLLAWAGAISLLCAFSLIEHGDRLPAWWALLPVVGTLALLAAGPHAWINRQVLSNSVLRFYGLISYPLYLWHWPLLSFPTVLGVSLTNDVRLMVLLASVVLAALTYELVEKPVRSAAANARSALALGAMLGLVAALGWMVLATDGLSATYPAATRTAAGP